MGDLYKTKLKRVFDVVGAIILLIATSPILIITAVLIRICLGSTVIFKQQRPGLYGKIFVLYKFRTMKNLYHEDGNPLSDEKRLTKFGLFLRRLDLDELPELWNILKGDMSFVGPRPLLVEYLGKYKSSQFQRHDVKPGLTCLGVLKRCNMSWKEQFKYDILYVKNVNFLLDVKLIVYTLYAVALQRGKKGGTWTREKFC